MLFQWLVGSEQGACMTKEAVKKWKSIFTASASFGWCRRPDSNRHVFWDA
jgi:hypothetical protein